MNLQLEATSFKIGAIALQGPHHSAEKSTNTGFSPFINSLNDTFCSILKMFKLFQ